ncbi:dihydropteroate synthase [Oscillospiraceae bacterium WX1]
MIIIGEKINGAIPKTAEAIKNRDEAYIVGLVKAQEENGADYLDVCAGTSPEEEYDALCWLLDIVQKHATKPLCIDSPDPIMLIRIFPQLKKPGLLNSISMEGEKCQLLLPLLRDNPEWQVVALACDNGGIAASADDKVRIAFDLVEKAAAYGVGPERIHIDPLVLALSAVNDSAVQFCEAIRRIKEKYPTVNITAALSNVSFAMPERKLVNRSFLTMSMMSGLDSVIADPANKDIIGTIYATDALLGRDRFCRQYNKAFREGKLATAKK